MISNKSEILRTRRHKSSKSLITERPQERQNCKYHKENGKMPRKPLLKTDKLFNKLNRPLMTQMLMLEQRLRLRLIRLQLRMRLKVLKMLLIQSSPLLRTT